MKLKAIKGEYLIASEKICKEIWMDDRDWNCILLGAKTIKMCNTLIQLTYLGEKNMQFDKHKIFNNPVLSSDLKNLYGGRIKCNVVLPPINW